MTNVIHFLLVKTLSRDKVNYFIFFPGVYDKNSFITKNIKVI